jgi:hypothetical protein
MPLLTELGNFPWGGCYKDAAPTALKQNRCAFAQGLGGELFQLWVAEGVQFGIVANEDFNSVQAARAAKWPGLYFFNGLRSE